MNNACEIINKLDEVNNKLSTLNNNEIEDVLIELTLAIELITDYLQIIQSNNK